jgi:nucleoside permease NupC
MTGGMATIAGGVLAGYVAFLGGNDPVEQTKYASKMQLVQKTRGIVSWSIIYAQICTT